MADSESKVLEPASSLEGSERKQNALEKRDTCLSGEWSGEIHVFLLKTVSIHRH